MMRCSITLSTPAAVMPIATGQMVTEVPTGGADDADRY